MEEPLPGITAKQLLGRVNDSGLVFERVTSRKLYRWQQSGPFPHPLPFRIRGQRGVKQLYHENAVVQLVQVANAVDRFGDLKNATWRLFLAHDFVPIERVLSILRSRIDQAAKSAHLLEVLENELGKDRAPHWERMESRLKTRSNGTLEGLVRRHFGKNALTFQMRALDFEAGCFEFYEYRDNVEHFRKIAGDSPLPDDDGWREFGSIVSSFSAEALEETLKSYGTNEILIARNEALVIQARRDILTEGLHDRRGYFLEHFANEVFENASVQFEAESHLFLLWLAVRRRPEFRSFYQWMAGQVDKSLTAPQGLI